MDHGEHRVIAKARHFFGEIANRRQDRGSTATSLADTGNRKNGIIPHAVASG
jgi:hypothetical protein